MITAYPNADGDYMLEYRTTDEESVTP